MLATALILLFGLFALSIPVAAVLFSLGVALDWLYAPVSLLRALDQILWRTNTNFVLVAIPLFVLLGELLLGSGVAEKVYDALNKWLSWIPGGLLHANIAASATFSATSGSSVATAATVGTIALAQGRKFGYNEGLFTGSIAAGGTLGILIPPSINLIIYGFMTQTSVPKLFLAGIVPGLVLAAIFMLIIGTLCVIRPDWGGHREPVTWRQRIEALPHLLPIAFLFVVVVGSIYLGWATPTEAAAVGVLCAFVLAAVYRGLSWPMLRQALEGTIRTTSMIMLILLGAHFLNFVLATIGFTRQLTNYFNGLDLSPMHILWLIIGFYIVLGFFVETLSIMVITIPIITPIIVNLGYDPIWFGILLIVLIEMALITPPVGLNLYVVQGIRGHGSLNDVIVGATPFVVAMFFMVVLLVAFPQLALYIPSLGQN